MMKSRYSGWQAFKMKGRRFLALIALDGNTAHIYNAAFGNYGCWFSVDSFKKHYAKDGETLLLDNPSDSEKAAKE